MSGAPTWHVHEGDCREVMRGMEADSVDAVCTDPPYALPGGFMNKGWDKFDGREDVAFGYWLAGFADGEGCFRMQRHKRGTHTCAFQIKVRRDDRAILERIRRFIGHGTIREGEGSGNAHPQAALVVQDKKGCAVVADLFRRFPLAAKKRLDFEAWAEAVDEWNSRPRGTRWHGAADQTRAAALKGRVERAREYVEVPWSGHRFQDWTRQWAAECLRVLKPGGHLVAFGAPRSGHRLAAGLEDAGFEIRDSLCWLFGSGFPKSLNVGDGLGTALKPAHEPIILARKPLAGTVAGNVTEHGTGALNIDGCRIKYETRDRDTSGGVSMFGMGRGGGAFLPTSGRYPANVVLDEEAARLLDEHAGERRSAYPGNDEAAAAYEGSPVDSDAVVSFGADNAGRAYADFGGASRFFYVAKASRSEREAGLEHRPATHVNDGRETSIDKPYQRGDTQRRNTHPTVKPISLMRWLVRLITPPDGVVLDPFCGSGSTGCAALMEWRSFVGIDLSAEYASIARDRIRHWEQVGAQKPLDLGGAA